MASQSGIAAKSKLAQMQMKYHKKQMEEREQRKKGLAGDNKPDDSSLASKTIGNGKVRQLFDERRRGPGIDRSNPLEPISMAGKTSSINTKTVPALSSTIGTATTTTTTTTTTKRSTYYKSPNNNNYNINNNNKTTQRSNNTINNRTNSTIMSKAFRDPQDKMDKFSSTTITKEFSTLGINDHYNINDYIIDDYINNNDDTYDTHKNGYGIEETVADGPKVITKRQTIQSNPIKLNPVITKKSPNVVSTTTKPRVTKSLPTGNTRSSGGGNSRQVTQVVNKKVIVSPTNRINNSTKNMAAKPPPRVTTPPEGMSTCRYCHRHFNVDRLPKHEEVCKKMVNIKRKIFDATTHRVRGTEAEKFVKKQASGRISGINTISRYSSAAAVTNLKMEPNQAVKKSNWRKKHEEFITAIREAKKVQAHLARGGKLSDLPPPPPSDTSDYIQCPHCGRRFNENAAERHIPKCANMRHNKPNPNLKRN